MDEKLTTVTALWQEGSCLSIAIFVICYSRVKQVENEEAEPGLKLKLLDNEENLFDLGLYMGWEERSVIDLAHGHDGGRKYTRPCWCLYFYALRNSFCRGLKIFIVRPFRNHLLVQQTKVPQGNAQQMARHTEMQLLLVAAFPF